MVIGGAVNTSCGPQRVGEFASLTVRMVRGNSVVVMRRDHPARDVERVHRRREDSTAWERLSPGRYLLLLISRRVANALGSGVHAQPGVRPRGGYVRSGLTLSRCAHTRCNSCTAGNTGRSIAW